MLDMTKLCGDVFISEQKHKIVFFQTQISNLKLSDINSETWILLPIDLLQKDWNNGYVLSELVQALGGQIPGWPAFDTTNWMGTIESGKSNI